MPVISTSIYKTTATQKKKKSPKKKMFLGIWQAYFKIYSSRIAKTFLKNKNKVKEIALRYIQTD